MVYHLSKHKKNFVTLRFRRNDEKIYHSNNTFSSRYKNILSYIDTILLFPIQYNWNYAIIVCRYIIIWLSFKVSPVHHILYSFKVLTYKNFNVSSYKLYISWWHPILYRYLSKILRINYPLYKRRSFIYNLIANIFHDNGKIYYKTIL